MSASNRIVNIGSFGLAVLLATALSAGIVACGAAAQNGEDHPSTGGTNAGGSGGSGANSGSGGFTSAGGSSSGGSGGKITLDSGLPDAPELSADAACAADTFQAEPAPLNLMVMLDRSCSMSEPTSDPLWDRTKNGLSKFFSDPAADGIGVALSYFPAPDTNDTTYCAGDEFTPTVALGKLTAESAPSDAQEQKLLDSMAVQTFNFGGTPMYQALYGALAFATVYANQHTDEQIVVVLVTDGVPGESCDYLTNNNIPKIAAMAQWAHDNPPNVVTFAIGLSGSQEQDMQTIAQAGGGQAFFLGASPNVTSDLFAKLDSIKVSNLGCTFKLPQGSQKKPSDPSKVNVKLLSASGDTKFYKVAGKSACVPDGWYYDDEQHPSKIELCPDACQSVKGKPDGNVQVLVGCATEVPK